MSHDNDFGLRTVFGPDGSMHVEQTVGSMRYDLVTGQTSYVVGSPEGPHTVIRPDGTTAFEQHIAGSGMRYSSDRGLESLF